MDLRLSTDPYESFRLFQGRMLEQYLSMSTEFNFTVIDANDLIESQQALVRELVAHKLNLAGFQRAEKPTAKPVAALTKTSSTGTKTVRAEEPVE